RAGAVTPSARGRGRTAGGFRPLLRGCPPRVPSGRATTNTPGTTVVTERRTIREHVPLLVRGASPPGAEKPSRHDQEQPWGLGGVPPTTKKRGVGDCVRENLPTTTPHPTRVCTAATYSPTPPRGSTIGAGRLNDRVRKGTGWTPPAMTAVTLTPHPTKRAGKPTHAESCARTPCICGGQALGRLVPVSSTPHRASTSGLSTPSSLGSLTHSRWQETSSR